MIRSKDIERFTEGDCFILAKTLYRITGWPIWAYSNDAGEPEWHAFIRMDDGRALDVQGPCDFDLFCIRWHHPYFVPKEFPYKALNGYGTAFGKHSYRRAHQVAKELLEALDNEPQLCYGSLL